MSEWLEAITTLRREQVEKPPAGFKTRAEIQKEIGTSDAHAQRVIAKMLSAGLAERRDFRIQNGTVARMVPHYRLRKIAKESQGKRPKRAS